MWASVHSTQLVFTELGARLSGVQSPFFDQHINAMLHSVHCSVWHFDTVIGGY